MSTRETNCHSRTGTALRERCQSNYNHCPNLNIVSASSLCNWATLSYSIFVLFPSRSLPRSLPCRNLSGYLILPCSIFKLSPVKRICVFEHSVMTNFNCACPAIQRGQGSGFLSEGSSWLTAYMSEQRRFWRDCADAQARLNLRCSHRLCTKFAWCGPINIYLYKKRRSVR